MSHGTLISCGQFNNLTSSQDTHKRDVIWLNHHFLLQLPKEIKSPVDMAVMCQLADNCIPVAVFFSGISLVQSIRRRRAAFGGRWNPGRVAVGPVVAGDEAYAANRDLGRSLDWQPRREEAGVA